MNVVFLAEEWGSSKGGLSTINRELAKQFAECPSVGRVTVLVPPGQDSQVKEEALSYGVHLVEAQKYPGMDGAQSLFFPPEDLEMDVVIGHGHQLGPQAQRIRDARKCLWVQFVHTACEELGLYKGLKEYEDKHKIEIELCEKADLVVAIGSKLAGTYTTGLRYCGKTVEIFTPGLSEEFVELTPAEEDTRNQTILVIGCCDEKDFQVKGYDIAAQAVGGMRQGKYNLTFVGAPEGKQEEVMEKFLKQGIGKNQLKVRTFCESREQLARMFCEADLCIMPSRTEGFGLTALEALSAGVPILVAQNSGFGEALEEVVHGRSCTVDSDDSEEWRKRIIGVLETQRSLRLKEAAGIRDSYNAKYPWTGQCSKLIESICRIKVSPKLCLIYDVDVLCLYLGDKYCKSAKSVGKL